MRVILTGWLSSFSSDGGMATIGCTYGYIDTDHTCVFAQSLRIGVSVGFPHVCRQLYSRPGITLKLMACSACSLKCVSYCFAILPFLRSVLVALDGVPGRIAGDLKGRPAVHRKISLCGMIHVAILLVRSKVPVLCFATAVLHSRVELGHVSADLLAKGGSTSGVESIRGIYL